MHVLKNLVTDKEDMENSNLKIVFATGNPHKVHEINEISKGHGIEFVLPPKDFDPIENGTTFEQNSFIKAQTAAKLSKNITLADDSGLCVEVLGNAPGIFSARYAETPQARIDKLLKNMYGKENRKAKFVCAMTLLDSDGNILDQEVGECHGKIAKEQFGSNGFGYDPIFLVNGKNATMAELSEDEKNKISHRGKALRNVLEFLSENKIS